VDVNGFNGNFKFLFVIFKGVLVQI
jgi:hypothetical protein